MECAANANSYSAYSDLWASSRVRCRWDGDSRQALTDSHGREQRRHQEVVARRHTDDFVAERVQTTHECGGTPSSAEHNDSLLTKSTALEQKVLNNLERSLSESKI